ncbi:MAG: hypothetical protein QG585_38 [Patescibacteria group bacterium]|jgi:cell division protein FtsB|nr:hypothetical protein [Patescibacteria group bacterium]
MREFQQKQIFKEKLYSKTTVFILLVLALLLAKGVVNIYIKERESRKNKEEAELELINMQNRAEELKQASERLKTPVGIEQEIRSKFGVAKEGEKVILIVEEEETIPVEQKEGFFGRFFKVLKFW